MNCGEKFLGAETFNEMMKEALRGGSSDGRIEEHRLHNKFPGRWTMKQIMEKWAIRSKRFEWAESTKE